MISRSWSVCCTLPRLARVRFEINGRERPTRLVVPLFVWSVSVPVVASLGFVARERVWHREYVQTGRLTVEVAYNVREDVAYVYRIVHRSRRLILGTTPVEKRPYDLRLEVRYVGDGLVDEVSVRSADRILGSMLSGFAWSRWLRIAETVRTVALDPPSRADEDRRRKNRAVLDAVLAVQGERPSRPAVRNLPDEFYREVGRLADELSDNGVSDLAGSIAKIAGLDPESFTDYERARNWLKKARRMGYARPGRRGRPPKGDPQ